MKQGRIAQYWEENPKIRAFVAAMQGETDVCEVQRRVSRRFGYRKRPTLPALMAALKGDWTGRRTDRDGTGSRIKSGMTGGEIATSPAAPRNDKKPGSQIESGMTMDGGETVERLMAIPDVAAECRIKGITRLSGRSCLLSQCASRYRRYLRLDTNFGGEKGDEHLHQRFLACRDCVHWLNDYEYRRGIEWLRRERPFGENYRGALRRDTTGRASSW